MPEFKSLQQKKAGILDAIASLDPMRAGSVCEQFQRTKHKDGTLTKRGPYAMYTRKKNGKTVGKRLSQQEAPLYRRQIDLFRKFQELSAEFVETSERLADLEVVAETEGKKNSRGKSRKKPSEKSRR